MLKGKNILLGVTGSIAAYKAAILIRELVKQGAEVKVLMTPFAKKFISPLTMATLSKNPILVDFFNPENGDWNSHVDLGLWADAYLVAPATANTLGKMAHGIADNLLLTTYFSARCPVFIAPAMDLDMFQHPATSENIKTLIKFGNHIIEPATGELASGLEGKGRMEEPGGITKYLVNYFHQHDLKKKAQPTQLLNKTILLTAGPTQEAIDPVRYISNRSSGKMGYALALAFAEYNDVILISGPTNLKIHHPRIKVVPVISADQMYNQSLKYFSHCHGAILCAAVADYKPADYSTEKIKRSSAETHIRLSPNKDIAAALGKQKQAKQFLVGFALESNNEIENARRKLASKNLDIVVLNSINDKGATFESNDNKITIIDKNNKILTFELKPKEQVANDIFKFTDNYVNSTH